MTLISLAYPSNPLSKYITPKPPSTSPAFISGPSILFESRDCAMQCGLLGPCLSPQIMSWRCHLGWTPGKKILGRRNDSGRNQEAVLAQLFSDAVQASNVGQGVARKAMHNCWKCLSISFSLQINSFFQLPLLWLSFSCHTFQGGDLWSPHPSPGSWAHSHSFLFIPQCDHSLVSVYLCQNVNNMLCVLFPKSPEERPEQSKHTSV